MPAPQDSDFWMNAVLVGYCVIGLPIAWWHLRREGVRKEDLPEQRRMRYLLFVFIAGLWPVLLLAFGAAWLGNRLDKPKGQ